MRNTRAYVISAGRPTNVPKMLALAGGLPLTWCVPGDEVGEYRAAGAENVLATGDLMSSRNAALDDAQRQEADCLQLSDDLKSVRWTQSKDNKKRKTISLKEAVGFMGHALTEHPHARLAGVAPTDNAFFYNQPYSTKLFIVGDMILVDHRCPLRFDTVLTLKEDYDYTLQHLENYGAVIRCNQILASFQHRTNRGGAVAYRSPQREEENIAYLKRKWPGRIVDNPRRPHEVLLKW